MIQTKREKQIAAKYTSSDISKILGCLLKVLWMFCLSNFVMKNH